MSNSRVDVLLIEEFITPSWTNTLHISEFFTPIVSCPIVQFVVCNEYRLSTIILFLVEGCVNLIHCKYIYCPKSTQMPRLLVRLCKVARILFVPRWLCIPRPCWLSFCALSQISMKSSISPAPSKCGKFCFRLADPRRWAMVRHQTFVWDPIWFISTESSISAWGSGG